MVLLAVIMGMSAGCGSTDGGGGKRDGFETSVAEIYALGEVLGARDAAAGFPSDYTRHLESLDSMFIAQFRLGYDRGYAMYRR